VDRRFAGHALDFIPGRASGWPSFPSEEAAQAVALRKP
jgi:hypothetical protein